MNAGKIPFVRPFAKVAFSKQIPVFFKEYFSGEIGKKSLVVCFSSKKKRKYTQKVFIYAF